jgi:hypothetical protein
MYVYISRYKFYDGLLMKFDDLVIHVGILHDGTTRSIE